MSLWSINFVFIWRKVVHFYKYSTLKLVIMASRAYLMFPADDKTLILVHENRLPTKSMTMQQTSVDKKNKSLRWK